MIFGINTGTSLMDLLLLVCVLGIIFFNPWHQLTEYGVMTKMMLCRYRDLWWAASYSYIYMNIYMVKTRIKLLIINYCTTSKLPGHTIINCLLFDNCLLL